MERKTAFFFATLCVVVDSLVLIPLVILFIVFALQLSFDLLIVPKADILG